MIFHVFIEHIPLNNNRGYMFIYGSIEKSSLDIILCSLRKESNWGLEWHRGDNSILIWGDYYFKLYYKPVKITVNKKQCTLLIQTIKYIYMFNYVQIHKYLKNVRYSLMGLGVSWEGCVCYYGKCDFSN